MIFKFIIITMDNKIMQNKIKMRMKGWPLHHPQGSIKIKTISMENNNKTMMKALAKLI